MTLIADDKVCMNAQNDEQQRAHPEKRRNVDL
jgi:hypothetical protein